MNAGEFSRSGDTPVADSAGGTAGVRPSGTQTRRQECRRSDEPLRIVLFGPESTGKTSLASWLAGEFGEPWAAEYVRAFWEQCAGRIEAADLDAIARGQVDAEEAAARAARRMAFFDTDLLTNVLWADLLFPGACPPWVRAAAEERSRRHALYLFCDTDLAFEPDPQRCFPDEADRVRCRTLWWDTLSSRDLPVVRIHGKPDNRKSIARAAVVALATQK
jgi:nicotinamide riboside kinase